jgi:hypothetical protein
MGEFGHAAKSRIADFRLPPSDLGREPITRGPDYCSLMVKSILA